MSFGAVFFVFLISFFVKTEASSNGNLSAVNLTPKVTSTTVAPALGAYILAALGQTSSTEVKNITRSALNNTTTMNASSSSTSVPRLVCYTNTNKCFTDIFYTSPTIARTGSGPEYATSCSNVLSSYTSASNSWVDKHSYTSNYTDIIGGTSWIPVTYYANATTLCDGHARVNYSPALATSSTTIKSVATSASTSIGKASMGWIFPIETPSCTIKPSDCDGLWKAYSTRSSQWAAGANATHASDAVFPTITASPSIPPCINSSQSASDEAFSSSFYGCGLCTIFGNEVQLIYFPEPTTVSRDMCAQTPSAKLTAYGKNDGFPYTRDQSATWNGSGTPPETAVYGDHTFTSGTAYISIKKVWAVDRCSSRIGTTVSDAILALPSSRLLSLRYSQNHFQYFATTDKVTGYPFNYADLNTPVPYSAWNGQAKCEFPGAADYKCDVIYDNQYNPQLAMPPGIRKLNSNWEGCQMWYGGLYDPPYALKPGTAVATPTVNFATPQKTSDAAEASSVTATTPAPTALADQTSDVESATQNQQDSSENTQGGNGDQRTQDAQPASTQAVATQGRNQDTQVVQTQNAAQTTQGAATHQEDQNTQAGSANNQGGDSQASGQTQAGDQGTQGAADSQAQSTQTGSSSNQDDDVQNNGQSTQGAADNQGAKNTQGGSQNNQGAKNTQGGSQNNQGAAQTTQGGQSQNGAQNSQGDQAEGGAQNTQASQDQSGAQQTQGGSDGNTQGGQTQAGAQGTQGSQDDQDSNNQGSQGQGGLATPTAAGAQSTSGGHTVQSPHVHVFTADTLTFTATSTGTFYICGTATVSVGGPAATLPMDFVISAGTNGLVVVSGPTTVTNHASAITVNAIAPTNAAILANPGHSSNSGGADNFANTADAANAVNTAHSAITAAPAVTKVVVLTVGTKTTRVSCDSAGVIDIDSTKISLGGPAATLIDGSVVSAASDGVMVGSTTVRYSTVTPPVTRSPSTFAGPDVVVFVVGTKTVTASCPAGSTNQAVIGSITLTAGGPAQTLEGGSRVSFASGGVILVDGTTAASINTAASAIAFTVNGTPVTAYEAADVTDVATIDGTVISQGGSAATLSGGEMISMGTGGIVIQKGTSTVPASAFTTMDSSSDDSSLVSGASGSGSGSRSGSQSGARSNSAVISSRTQQAAQGTQASATTSTLSASAGSILQISTRASLLTAALLISPLFFAIHL